MPSRRTLLSTMASAGAVLAIGPIAMPARAAGAARYAWRSVPFGGGGFVNGFAWHPREKGLLYTRTDVGGAYRYDPVAKRWLPLLDHLGRDEGDLMGVLSIALDPANPDVVHLACGEYLGAFAQDAAVLSSFDRGRTWRKTPLGLKLGGNGDGRGGGERLQVDPNKPDILVLGTSQDGLQRSVDGGKSFRRIAAFPAKRVSLVLFDAKSGKPGVPSATLYVGADNGDGTGALYASSDGGATFARMDGAPRLVPQRAALDGDGNLYTTWLDGGAPAGGKAGGVWKRDAGTGRWRDISPMKPGGANPLFGYCALDTHPLRPGTLIAGTMNRWALHDDIYLSRDGGNSWKPIGAYARHDPGRYAWAKAYMKGEDIMGHWIADARFDPSDPDTMLYGTGYGVWMTHDLGAADSGGTVNFEFAVDNLEETVTLDVMSPSGGATLFVAVGDVSGAAYDDLAKTPAAGLFLPVTENSVSIDCPELAPKHVVRTVDGPAGGYVSHDGGASWQPFPARPRLADGQQGWRGGGKIAISAKGGSLVWVPNRQTAYHSSDWGKTWNACQGWPQGLDGQFEPVADRAVEGVFYTYDRVASILISVDGGTAFKPVISGLPKLEGWQGAQLVATPGKMRDLWLAGPWGLFHSAGPDTNMAQIKGVTEAWLVCLGKSAADGGYPAVYLWGKVRGIEGVWRSDDIGGTWARINDDAHRFGALRTIAADPLEYGTVYLGTSGRGVIVGKVAA
ncbi:MAG: hypothetical protein JF608_03710 [Sphingomonadales bacterium]|nr:hypothetical protein [Sphingomonadales bacterium]